jgi:hypothetical protein
VYHLYIGIDPYHEIPSLNIVLVRFLLVLNGIYLLNAINPSFSVSIPLTVTVSADITPTESKSSCTFVSHLSGLDLALSKLADFGNVYNATIDKTWESRNMNKTVELQDFFDFVWGDKMGDRAAGMMADDLNNFFHTN